MTTDNNNANAECHTNDNYIVRVNGDGDGYVVVNSTTNVIEFRSESLPEAIFAAENLNVVLVHNTYEWVAKRAREKAAQDAGIQSIAPVSSLQ